MDERLYYYLDIEEGDPRLFTAYRNNLNVKNIYKYYDFYLDGCYQELLSKVKTSKP